MIFRLEHPLREAFAPRVEVEFAPLIGFGIFIVTLIAVILAGSLHAVPRVLLVFAVAFPLLWVVLASLLSYTSAYALHMVEVDIPTRLHAMGKFRLGFALTLGKHAFPAIGIMVNTRFRTPDVAIESGPWAEIPLLEAGRGASAHWDVVAKERGMLYVGPFRAAIELPGSAVRATAVFETFRAVTILPAIYHLEPFVDALLAGRHLAAGRYQKVPTAIEEYVGAREYRPGDSPKLIHRVLSLRTGDPNELYVREFQDPSRDDICMVLDTAPPLDGDKSLHRYRLEKAICFACALCRTFAARRLTVRFVYQYGERIEALRIRPLDLDIERLEMQMAHVTLIGDRNVIDEMLREEVRHHGASVIFVSLRPNESVAHQRLPIVTLTPDHVPIFTREVVQ